MILKSFAMEEINICVFVLHRLISDNFKLMQV